jgi:hypothetical protein
LSLIELVEEEMEKAPAKKPAKKSAASAAEPKEKVARAPRKPKVVEEQAVEESKESSDTPEQA